MRKKNKIKEILEKLKEAFFEDIYIGEINGNFFGEFNNDTFD